MSEKDKDGTFVPTELTVRASDELEAELNVPLHINISYNSDEEKKQAFSKILETLNNGPNGGIVDIIWGPDIEFTESVTMVGNNGTWATPPVVKDGNEASS
jgi:hypothetical protein